MKITFSLFLLLIFSCNPSVPIDESTTTQNIVPVTVPSLIILGTVQDAGSPHIGCKKDCCKELFENPDKNRMVVSLGIIDPENKMKWIIEASPDISRQLKMLRAHTDFSSQDVPDGIFLTHAHVGHYTGLMYLGREALGAKAVPVYAMTRMKSYLESNGPWSQLVQLNNIRLHELSAEKEIALSSNIKIKAFTVPHRDEFSETVGYIIEGPEKKVLFIPDIDKWEKWERSIVDEIKKVDYAFLDGSFYDGEELDHRDIKEVPHPSVRESMELFEILPDDQKAKVYFIHFNHTNPLLNPETSPYKKVMERGYGIAQTANVVPL